MHIPFHVLTNAASSKARTSQSFLSSLLRSVTSDPPAAASLEEDSGGELSAAAVFTVLWSFQMRWWSRDPVRRHPSAPVLLPASTDPGQVLIPVQLRTIPSPARSLAP